MALTDKELAEEAHEYPLSKHFDPCPKCGATRSEVHSRLWPLSCRETLEWKRTARRRRRVAAYAAKMGRPHDDVLALPKIARRTRHGAGLPGFDRP
jgi:hypothetical protein